MSPLARSLLALAALLAAASAQDQDIQDYNCVRKIIGRQTSDSIVLTPVDLKTFDSIDVQNYCSPPRSRHHVGEIVKVCNKTPGYLPADIIAPIPPALTPVTTICHDPHGCTGYVTEYCYTSKN